MALFFSLFIVSCETEDDSINEVPAIAITSPSNSDVFVNGDEITFTCSAFDKEDGESIGANVVWTSDVDGSIGTGITFSVSTLSVATHKIVATLSDSENNVSSDTISISIRDANAPVVVISDITDGDKFVVDSTVTFTCTATDDIDGNLSDASIKWMSDIDGELGTGLSLQVSTLSIGIHSIIVEAKDNSGNTASDTVGIEVYELEGPLEIMMGWMTGKYSSANQAETSSDPYHFDVRRKAQRFWANEADGYWLYIEQAFAGSENEPYFQRVYHFYIENDSVQNIVYKINNATAYIGAWKTPEDFDKITIADLSLRDECGAAFNWDEDHFYGTTWGKNCLSTYSDIAYMTSEQWIFEDQWHSYDLGWNANDVIVMGPYSPYKFDKVEDFPFVK